MMTGDNIDTRRELSNHHGKKCDISVNVWSHYYSINRRQEYSFNPPVGNQIGRTYKGSCIIAVNLTACIW